jgi:large subunit ribosomal protein L10
MSKLVKNLEYAALEKSFKGVRNLVLISPTKIHAALDVTFRKTLREQNIRVQMVKNNLAKRVLKDQGVEVDDKHWSGTTLVAWGAESIKDLAKAIDGLIKDIEKKDPKNKEKYIVKTAVADGIPVPLSVAVTIPTRLEAIGEIVSAIMAPASALAGCLIGPGAQVASQIATLADKKEDAPAAA